jgi:uncharacterized cupin superfamily protein
MRAARVNRGALPVHQEPLMSPAKPALDPVAVAAVSHTSYPPAYRARVLPRQVRALGDALGLTHIGVNLVHLLPGKESSMRHWHTHEDEFVYVLEGEVVLVTDAGEETMFPGDCAGFKGCVRDGHCFQNRSHSDVRLLVVGSRIDQDHGEYPDIDLVFTSGRYSGRGGYRRKDGTPYSK